MWIKEKGWGREKDDIDWDSFSLWRDYLVRTSTYWTWWAKYTQCLRDKEKRSKDIHITKTMWRLNRRLQKFKGKCKRRKC